MKVTEGDFGFIVDECKRVDKDIRKLKNCLRSQTLVELIYDIEGRLKYGCNIEVNRRKYKIAMVMYDLEYDSYTWYVRLFTKRHKSYHWMNPAKFRIRRG